MAIEPAWKDKPDCVGYWFTDDGFFRRIVLHGDTLESQRDDGRSYNLDIYEHEQWYGPIPEPTPPPKPTPPKPMELPRRFRCQTLLGLNGVGAYFGDTTGQSPYRILWDADIHNLQPWSQTEIDNIQITEWIDP